MIKTLMMCLGVILLVSIVNGKCYQITNNPFFLDFFWKWGIILLNLLYFTASPVAQDIPVIPYLLGKVGIAIPAAPAAIAAPAAPVAPPAAPAAAAPVAPPAPPATP